MPKLSRKQLESLAGINDTDRADLLALFTEAEESEREVAELRKKVPSDSERVVKNSEYTKMEKALGERDAKLKALETKMSETNLRPATDEEINPLEAFRPIFDLISGE